VGVKYVVLGCNSLSLATIKLLLYFYSFSTLLCISGRDKVEDDKEYSVLINESGVADVSTKNDKQL